MPQEVPIAVRRGTVATWRAANPIPDSGEPIYETDTHKARFGDGVTAYNSLGFPIVPRFNDVDGDPRRFTLSQLAEGFFFKDDFSNNTSGGYLGDVGSFTWDTANKRVSTTTTLKTIYRSTTSYTDGKWGLTVQCDGTAYLYFALVLKYSGANLRAVVYTSGANWKVYLMDTAGGYIVSTVDTGIANDSAAHRFEITYTSGSYQLYFDGVAQGALTASSITPNTIGIASLSSGTLYFSDLTYTPTIAFSDSYSSDTEARYHQLASTDLTTWAAAAAGDVAVSGGALVLASDDDRGIAVALRSYNFKSGEIECSFDNNNDGGGGADTCCLLFGYQDINNYYRLALEDDTAGAENLKLYKVVAGSSTQLGTTKDVSATYTRSNKTWIKVQWDSEKGRIWAWLRDNAGTYPTTPDISDAFSAAFSMGKVGYRATVTTAGAGNLNVAFDDLTVRCNCLIGETNVPATETGFYLRDEFSVDSIGRYITTGTWAVTGGVLSCSSTGNCTWPYQTTIGVHTFTPMLADGTHYYYFGGYRVKFVASGGNSCVITLETSAGVAQGSGSLTVSTTSGAFANPIVITETSSSITLTVSGATGTITPGTTTSTNAYPKLTVGAATSTFDNYSFSGTRYYNKPMLRGAQIGEWWDGSKSVYGTRFTDDYDWNSIGEYTGVSTSAVDTANGYLTLSDTTYIYPTGPSFSAGSAHITLIRSAASGSVDFTFCNNVINITYAGAVAFNGGAAESWSVDALSSAVRIMFYASGTSMEVWSNGVLKGTKTGLTLATSNFKMKRNTADFYILSLQVNGYDSTAKLGLNLTLGGVPHGARYDTQEAATFSFTNLARYGKYFLIAAAKTCNASAEDAEFYFRNLTDTSNISLDATNTLDISLSATTPTDFTKELLLDSDDRGDTITLQARRKTAATDNSAAVFVEYASILPSMEVGTA